MIHEVGRRVPPFAVLPYRELLAYAAPSAGSGFFYIPMWSILPEIYAKYFGLKLTSIAASLLIIRLFDGLMDGAVGYLSDLHRRLGGTSRSWVIAGSLCTVIACGFLFAPPGPVSTGYYLGWSMAYFAAFSMTEIPHATWGNNLTMDYDARALVFGARNVMHKFGTTLFYALPILFSGLSLDYTPQILGVAIQFGAVMTVLGLTWAYLGAPKGAPYHTVHKDSLQLLLHTVTANKPLLIYLAAFVCGGICYGMWFGLFYFYLDAYLNLGSWVPPMFLIGGVLSVISTPIWIRLVRNTSKSSAWAICVTLFTMQLVASLWVTPHTPWWTALFLVAIAHVCFSGHDISTIAVLGDIVDYGKLRFGTDRGSTYVAAYTLLFKIGLGVGSAASIGVAGVFGFSPTLPVTGRALLGLHVGFVALPCCMGLLGLAFIILTPITRRRHRIIQRRLESRMTVSEQTDGA